MRKYFAILLAGLLSGAQAGIVTNRWTALTGGNWANPDNWSDPIMLGTNEATAAFFDLSAFPNGATNFVPSVSDNKGIRIYGLRIGVEAHPTNETWLLCKDANFPKDKHVLFRTMSNPDADNLSEVRVESGVLRIDGTFEGKAAVLKSGSGVFRSASTSAHDVDFRAVEGALEVVHPDSFLNSVVNLYTSNAVFRSYGTQTKYYLARLDSSTCEGRPVDFGTSELALAANQEDAWQNYDLIRGPGAISANSSATLRMNATQTGFSGTYRLAFGDIAFGYAFPNVRAAYCFDVASEPGEPTRIGETLTVVDDATVEQDDDRGSVLSLSGRGYLASGNPEKLPDGLCTGKGEYTIACWLKIAPDVDPQATLFYLGKWEVGAACILLRLDPGSSGTRGVLYTNYGNNQKVVTGKTEALYDGAWHHLAVTHGDGKSRLWIDGEMVNEYGASPNVQDGEFWIGHGKNGKSFKGRIDDFVFCNKALNATSINLLMRGDTLKQPVAGLLPENSIEAVQSGVMTLATTATVATLTGESYLAKVRMNGGLTVQGTAGAGVEATTFKSEITGTGDLVKKGSDYTLVLSGANTYTGGTRVAEGTLVLRGSRLQNKLVGRWTFDDEAHPGADASGNGFVLTADNVTVVSDSARGKVASFGGSAKLSSADYPEGFPANNDDYSISLWLKGAPSCNATAGIIAWGKTGNDNSCTLWRLDGTAGWMMTNWNQNHSGNGQSFRDDAWHHVVWVRASGEQRVYIDGVHVDTWTRSGDLTVELTGTTFNLGFNPYSKIYFTGLMDDVRVYNFALSEADACAEFQGTVAANEVLDDSYSLPVPDYLWDFESDNPGISTGTATDGALSVVGHARCAEIAGRPGKVLDLTGTQMSYLVAETLPQSLPTGGVPWSVTFWMQSTSSITADDCALYWGDPDSQFALFGFWDGNGKFRVTNSVGGDLSGSGYNMKPISAEALWHHVAATYDGAKLSLYLDGALVNTRNVNLKLGTRHFWIGRKASSETAWFHGYLDDVKIFTNHSLDVITLRRMIAAERLTASHSILPETTDLDIAEGASVSLEGTEQRVESLTGLGTVAVAQGSVLTVARSGLFEGTLDLHALDCLSLPAGVVLKAQNVCVGGVRKGAGIYTCGEGSLMIGSVGTMILFR